MLPGVTAICAAFFFSALTGVLSKFLHGTSALVTVFFQYGVSAAIFLPLALRHGFRGMETEHLPLQVVRSVAGAGAQVLYFASLAHLSLLNASLLSNASPLFIPFIIWLWLRKPIQPGVAISLIIGLVGVILVIRPSAQMLHDPSSLVALGSGVLSAIGLVTTNQLGKTDPPFRILAYNFGLATVLIAPFALRHFARVPAHALLLLILLGVCFALTQWLIIVAYRYGSASQLSPFNYSVVVFSGLLGWFVFGTVPAWTALLGTALIIAGGVASVRMGHREGKGHPVGNGHWNGAPHPHAT